MEQLKLIETAEKYNEIKTNLKKYTVSLTIDDELLHFKHRGYFISQYNVTSTSSEIQLLGDSFEITQIDEMYIDGVKLDTPVVSYTFSETRYTYN